MDTISTTELVRNIGKYAHLVRYSGRSLMVTANGRPMFAVVPPAELERLQSAAEDLETDREDRRFE